MNAAGLGPRRPPPWGAAGSPDGPVHNLTHVTGPGRRPQIAASRARKPRPDLRMMPPTGTIVHRSCASELCTGIVHSMAHTTPRTLPTTTASGSPRRACACWPTRCAPACSAPCGGRPRDGHRPRRRSAPTPARRATTCASSSRSGSSRTPGRARASGGCGGPPRSSTQWYPSDFAGDEDSETALGWLTRDYAATSASSTTAGSTSRRRGPPPGRTRADRATRWSSSRPSQLEAMRAEIGESSSATAGSDRATRRPVGSRSTPSPTRSTSTARRQTRTRLSR